MNVTVQRVAAGDADAYVDQLADIYREAYADPPYNEGEEHVAAFIERFARESQSPGFSLVVAKADNELVGYTHGLTFGPDDWWGSADHEPPYLRGHPKFAVMELAVRKRYRGRGIARSLMTGLLRDRTEPYATLCVNPAATARQIYDRWGWQMVARTQPGRPQGMPAMDVLVLDLAAHRPGVIPRRSD